MPCSDADCSRPKRLLRVISPSTRGLIPVFPLGLQATPPADCAGAVVLRGSGLRLKAEAISQRPTPRFNRLQDDRLAGCGASGVLDRCIHFIEERQFVKITLRVQQRSLIEWIAGMQRDGALHRIWPRVMQASNQHITHKNLWAFADVKSHVHLAGVVGFLLLRNVNTHLLEAAAQVFGEQCVAVAGEVLRRK